MQIPTGLRFARALPISINFTLPLSPAVADAAAANEHVKFDILFAVWMQL